tara:strand:+ start:1086 stop:1550 length:465 start_codon:yes stop_codon:yes gene_type:complete
VENVKNLDKSRVVSIIQRLDFFRDFKPPESETILQFYANFILFQKGEDIIVEGDKDDNCFYLLLTGKLNVTKNGKENTLAQLTPGEMFGEVSYLTGKPRTTSVHAEDMAMVLKLDRAMLSEVGPTIREKIKDKILEKLVSRLDKMNNMLLKLQV